MPRPTPRITVAHKVYSYTTDMFSNRNQMKMNFALWSRAAVNQLIKQEGHISMPIQTMEHYLQTLGIYTAKADQKNVWTATEGSQAVVRRATPGDCSSSTYRGRRNSLG